MAADNVTMLVGSAAAFCTTLSFVPQLVKIRRQGGRDLSDGMLVLYLLGLCAVARLRRPHRGRRSHRRQRRRRDPRDCRHGHEARRRASVGRRRTRRRARATNAGPMRTAGRRCCERVKALRPDSARRWGRMTAHQMLCHLIDCNRMALGELAVAAPKARVPRAIVKWVSLYTPMPWPAGLPTNPELDQDVSGDAAERLRSRRGRARGDRGAADVARRVAADWPPHPDFGVMSEGDWFRWAYLHMDHHLRQFGA